MTNRELAERVKEISKGLSFQFPYDPEEWIHMGMPVQNYHKHTTWSDFFQIDSATSIGDFMKKAQERGSDLYFSGEHGYQGEWLNCYDLCRQTEDEHTREKMGLTRPMKFRYSVEAYWVKDRLKEFTETYTDKNGNEKTRTKRDNMNCHMVLVARNYQAMRKLNYIISLANTDGYYYKPRIDLNLLYLLSPEDVYITSACVAGWKYEDAEDIWLDIWKHFGDSFFLEYQCHDTDKQKDLSSKIRNLSQKYGIQTIIGLDTHYISQEDSVKRDNLLIRKGLHYDDEDGWYMDYPDTYEIIQRMNQQGIVPIDETIRSLMNTQVFVNGCEDLDYDIGFKIPILPEFANLTYEERSNELKNLLNRKYSEEDSDHRSSERVDGIRYEYGQVHDAGVVDYFLSNEKIIDVAVHQNGGQLTTTSRGSASSYYISKLLGFSTMDRFESEVPLFPERFITKERILDSHQMPD